MPFSLQTLSTFFTAIIAERPNVAGLMLLIVSISRVLYALGYKKDVKSRFPPFLVAQFGGCVGIGYGALAAASVVGVGPFVK